jgi:hypothetical protein
MNYNYSIWNDMELFGTKFRCLELKRMKRNVLGVSLKGMSLSIDKTFQGGFSSKPCLIAKG